MIHDLNPDMDIQSSIVFVLSDSLRVLELVHPFSISAYLSQGCDGLEHILGYKVPKYIK